jgi:hypothetical protein
MALLSFRGISTPSLTAQGEQRRSSYFNIRRGDPLINVYTGEAIHVVRKGKAGHINYLESGDYTLNDDAYLLIEKAGHGYRVSLKWLALAYQQVFREYASNSDNGTWNMGGFFEHATFDIPAYEEQEMMLRASETSMAA